MSDFDYMVECTTRDLAQNVARDYNLGVRDALNLVYGSKTYAGLVNPATGLYFQSPGYVYSYLRDEIKAKSAHDGLVS